MDAVEVAKTLFFQGIEHLEKQEWRKAEDCFRKALRHAPERPSILHNLSVVLLKQDKLEDAARVIDQVLALEPDAPDGWISRAELFNKQKRPEDALISIDRALALQPDNPEAYLTRAVVLYDLGRQPDALASCDLAIRLNPQSSEAWANRGNALLALMRFEPAMESYDRALALRPDLAQNHLNHAIALIQLRRPLQALESAQRALALRPDYAEANVTAGAALSATADYAGAIAYYDRAVALKPDYPEAWANRASALDQLKEYSAAIDSYERALALKPDYDFIEGALLHAQMKISLWDGFETRVQRLEEAVGRGEKSCIPFTLLALSDSPSLQRKAAETWIHRSRLPDPRPAAASSRKPKIRVGYYSPDFRNHAVSILAAGLYERHDRHAFEIFGFSLGPRTNDDMRARVSVAFDRFIEIDDHNDVEVAAMSRELGIDIAIDLGGHTEHSRTRIFAARAAPIQVNFLGYPGTIGASYMDYIIGDAVVIPRYARANYTESVVQLPYCYQVNDTRRPLPTDTIPRETLGLPARDFVFCCFNNTFKITPEVFASWMRILAQVSRSVLWLLEDNQLASDNLRRAAACAGVAPERLIFAPRATPRQHLARHRAADLFLDTLPYTAHTTASDALWTGLPLLTLIGRSFPARVAASLLTTVGLPELITHTREDYEALAVRLAQNPQELTALRARLDRARSTTPLFDTALFARHIESAYREMWDRYLAGLPPTHFAVPA